MNAVSSANTHVKPANMRDQKDFDKARRHSRYVRYLKGLLPVAAICVVASFATMAMRSYVPVTEFGIESLGVDSGNLVMHKPKMAGYSKNGGAYAVTALKAIQNMKKPGIIQLREIDAKLPLDAKSTANVDADKGVYDSNNEKLHLSDNIKVKGARGMDISMQEADIDIKTGLLVSEKPVTVVSDDARITSDSLTVEDNGERIIFNKRVRMTIKKPVSRGVAQPAKGN